MTIHVLVEGSSERALLDRWAPRLGMSPIIRVHPHQGKGALPEPIDAPPIRDRRGLLDQLPAKLRGFSEAADRSALAIVILVDSDEEDPSALAERIKSIAAIVAPGLLVAVCVAVEETEAFYLGDLHGLSLAFPDADIKAARNYEPDSICGTWELFGRIIDDDSGNKVGWAERMGPRLTTIPARSRSPSFRKFVRQLRSVVPQKRAPSPAKGVGKR